MTLEAGISVGGGMPSLTNQYEVNTEVQFVHDLGATWIRFDLHWDTVETADGTFSGWAAFDRMWEAAKEFNLKVLWIVHKTPSWARSGGTNLTFPTTASDYGDFCAVAAARYVGCAWEMWNEPNGNWAATDVSTTGAQKLASMIADAAPKIRSADPTALVIGPGILRLGSAGSSTFRLDTEYLDDMYDGDLDPGDLDYLGFHPYNNDPHLDPTDSASTNGWNRVDDYVGIARSAGDTNIKAWITEVGYHTYVAAGSRPGATEAEQSTYLSSAFDVWQTLATNGYVDGPLFWYQTKDSESTYTNAVGEGAYGLVKNDRFTKKTAYNTYRTEAAALYASEYRFRAKAIRAGDAAVAFEDVSVPIEVSGDATATPATIAMTVAAPAASPAASSQVTAIVLAATTTAPAATARGHATSEPAVLAATMTTPAASPLASSVAVQTAIATVAALPAVTVSSGSSATATPAVIAAAVATPAATPQASSTPTPAAIANVVAAPAVTVTTSGNATATPAVLAAVVATPAAVASAASTPTPAVIATTTSLPAAAPSASVVKALAALAASMTTPAATIAAGSTPTPAVLAATVALPAVSPSVSAVVTAVVLALLMSMDDVVVMVDANGRIRLFSRAPKVKLRTYPTARVRHHDEGAD